MQRLSRLLSTLLAHTAHNPLDVLNLKLLQAYDLVAGTQGLTMSRYNTPLESHRQFPTLAQRRSEDGTSLKGTVSLWPAIRTPAATSAS